MANNQYVNKVVFGDETLIDLSQDTVAAASMLSGATAHDASGAIITGTIPIKSGLDISTYWDTQSTFHITMPIGYYNSIVNLGLSGIKIWPPEAGTNSFYIDFPNNSAPASADDWTRITFSVDANGNSNITDDTIPASGESF